MSVTGGMEAFKPTRLCRRVLRNGPSHPKQKRIVVFCAEGVEPRLGEDEFFIRESL